MYKKVEKNELCSFCSDDIAFVKVYDYKKAGDTYKPICKRCYGERNYKEKEKQ